MRPLVIGIAGGSGSGKTTVAQKIIERVGADHISLLEQDSYYKDLSHLSQKEREACNFDHPSILDTDFFIEQIKSIKSGSDVDKPMYDFVTHTRRKTTLKVPARQILIVEGILLYENSELRDILDVKIFVETPSDVRFIRRLMRDIKERGRSVDSVVRQYYETVRPMHKAFVEPSREYADIIIPWQGYNDVAIDMVISRIESRLSVFQTEKNFVAPDVFEGTGEGPQELQ